MKLTKKEIKNIIDYEFKYSAVMRAASLLYTSGVRVADLNEMKNLGDVKKSAVINALSTIERRMRE